MKALKTVAVALGITLGALDRHPARGPGRTVRLAEAHRRGGRGDARARPGRRLILDDRARDSQHDARRTGGRRVVRPGPIAGRATALRRRSVAAAPTGTARDRRLAELGVLVVMVFWAGNFIVVKGALGVLPPVGFTFLRYASPP